MRSNTEFHGNIAISDLPNRGQAVFAFTNTVEKAGENVTTIKVETKDKASGVIAAWGKNNDTPQKIMEAVRKNGTARRALEINIASHHGNGIILVGPSQADENGKKSPKLLNLSDYQDIQLFFRKNQVNKFFAETVTDLEWWNIGFPEYILSNNFATINRVRRQKAAWCRYEVMSELNGLIENIFISQKFGSGSVAPDSEFVSKVAIVDPYWSADEVREYCKANKIFKFIRPIFYPLLDEAYYPEAAWHSVTKSGWLEVANSVPAFKQALFNNQVNIKYIIEIAEEYFTNTYEDWQSLDATKRIGIRTKLIDTINESLVGNEKAGKSIQAMMIRDVDGKQISAIKITPIDDKFKDGSYLPEASAANSEIAVATGVDASLIGGSGIPGGNLGAGSGSDKRIAFDILTGLKKFQRMTSLSPLEFIHEYNQWPQEVSFAIESTVLTTLDDNPTGTKTATA
ncbi:hypothetical protein [Flavobacterium sp.]|uniref:hypothetical protein n=1 Tax=Flavobacterium sp. TaxID=239 RepID=UPI00121FDF18|nr:hypothetical protein [Flavobacterium sp.]RZJ71082.1 MAG: hypothetical protein EOO49_11555 [Flavobacterium sp.]